MKQVYFVIILSEEFLIYHFMVGLIYVTMSCSLTPFYRSRIKGSTHPHRKSRTVPPPLSFRCKVTVSVASFSERRPVCLPFLTQCVPSGPRGNSFSLQYKNNERLGSKRDRATGRSIGPRVYDVGCIAIRYSGSSVPLRCRRGLFCLDPKSREL